MKRWCERFNTTDATTGATALCWCRCDHVHSKSRGGFVENPGCVRRHTGTHSHSHTLTAHCVPRLPEPSSLYDARAHRKFRRARRRRTSLYGTSWWAERAMHSHLTLTMWRTPRWIAPLSRLASTSSVPRERSTPLIARDHLRPGLGSVSLRRSVRCQSVRYVAGHTRTHHSVRSLLPSRATFATHGPYTVRASAKCVSKHLLSWPHASASRACK